MSLLTEKGTGKGSHFGNITIRAWLALIIISAFVLNCLCCFTCQILNSIYGTNYPTTIEPNLAAMAGVVAGVYLKSTPALQPNKEKEE